MVCVLMCGTQTQRESDTVYLSLPITHIMSDSFFLHSLFHCAPVCEGVDVDGCAHVKWEVSQSTSKAHYVCC